MTIKIIKRNEESKNILEQIFNSANNPTFCASYGSGNHCDDDQSITKKLNLWGERGEENAENACSVARIVYLNDSDNPAALFNIGITGKFPTIIDKSNTTEGKVYEFSPIFITEEYLPHIIPVAISISDVLRSCETSEGYTKAFVSTNRDAPYQQDLFLAAGGIKLDENNYNDLLGLNPFHPERFLFDNNGQFLECKKWDEDAILIEHGEWHSSPQCVEWIEKDAFVFDISGGHFETHTDL